MGSNYFKVLDQIVDEAKKWGEVERLIHRRIKQLDDGLCDFDPDEITELLAEMVDVEPCMSHSDSRYFDYVLTVAAVAIEELRKMLKTNRARHLRYLSEQIEELEE